MPWRLRCQRENPDISRVFAGKHVYHQVRRYFRGQLGVALLEKELGRLAKQPYSSSEATVIRNYLDICLELPWGKRTKERSNVAAVRKTLDQDHGVQNTAG